MLRARSYDLEAEADRAWCVTGDRSAYIQHKIEMAEASRILARDYAENAAMAERLAGSTKADVYESRALAHDALGDPKRAAYMRRMAKRLRQAASP